MPLTPSPRSVVSRTRIVDWIVAALLVAANIIAADGFLPAMSRILNSTRWLDFQVYYLSGRMLLQSSAVYDAPSRRAVGAALDLNPMVYNYPPFFTLLITPLVELPFRTAGLVWLGFQFFCLAFIIVFLARIFHFDVWRIVVAGLVLLLMPSTLATLAVGQLSIFLTLLFAAVLALGLGSRLGKTTLPEGMLLGIAAGIKVYPILLAAPYLFQRRFKTLLIVGATFVATLLVGILFAGGIGETLVYWTQVLPGAGELNLYPPNQSARASIQRLFQAYPMETTVRRQQVTIPLIPLTEAPILGTIIGIGVVVLIIILTLLVMRRRAARMPERALFLYNYALMIPATLMIIPLSWDHYEPHLIIPLAVVGLVGGAGAVPRILFGLSCLLLVLHRYWNVVLFTTPYVWLMMSGFLGTLCIWLALLWNPVATEKVT